MTGKAARPTSAARRAALEVGDAAQFSAEVIRGTARIRPYAVEVMRQATILARGSVMIVLALVFAFGLVLGIESSYGARLVGAPSLAALGPALGGLRELTPYAFGYMMAAKVSTGYVAEIGTMRITEELDALDVMGLDTPVYVCTTRLLAVWIILPFIYGVAVVVGFLGAYIAVVLQIGQVSAGGYLTLFWQFQSGPDFLFSIFKGLLMGTYVVLVGVWYGFRVRGGPVEVGTATARAMVVNLVGIHLIGVLTSQVFWGGSARLPIGG
ncbi:MlaE family ABC transporter permease [Paraconexibacter sp.]|uniref:MlaE family ABC transporter permease n=1 Tax=Paraconexibacter sp. TaxID=2949640 RepID=UPI00356A4E44